MLFVGVPGRDIISQYRHLEKEQPRRRRRKEDKQACSTVEGVSQTTFDDSTDVPRWQVLSGVCFLSFGCHRAARLGRITYSFLQPQQS